MGDTDPERGFLLYSYNTITELTIFHKIHWDYESAVKEKDERIEGRDKNTHFFIESVPTSKRKPPEETESLPKKVILVFRDTKKDSLNEFNVSNSEEFIGEIKQNLKKKKKKRKQ